MLLLTMLFACGEKGSYNRCRPQVQQLKLLKDKNKLWRQQMKKLQTIQSKLLKMPNDITSGESKQKSQRLQLKLTKE